MLLQKECYHILSQTLKSLISFSHVDANPMMNKGEVKERAREPSSSLIPPLHWISFERRSNIAMIFFFVIVILPQICKKHLQRFDYSTSRSVFAHLLSICSKIPMCCWSRTVHMLGACLSMYQSAKKTKKIINIIVIIILLLYLDIFLPKGPTQLNLHND